MKVLGLYWGYCSSAAIFVDKQIIAAASEERYTGVKNDGAFPENAIKFCLEKANLRPRDLEGVAIASFDGGSVFDMLLRKASWSIDDYVMQQIKIWYPRFYENKEVNLTEIYKEKFDFGIYPQWYWKEALIHPDTFSEDREVIVARFLGISRDKIRRMEHHRCHAAYSFYASPFRGERVLAFTLDGFGDGLNATIGIFDEKGNYKRVYAYDQCNIGRIYRYITLLLGMKPNEHEYKVMGLAPYGTKVSERAYNLFKETLYVDGIEFKWKVKPRDSYFWFKERLEGCRFDGIASGLQRWAESLITEWVRNAVNAFNIRKVVLGGGVAMNVKANGRLIELDEIEDFFVGGTSSDESMAMSSAICLSEDISKENNLKWDVCEIRPIKHLYLGPEANGIQEKEAIGSLEKKGFQIKDKFSAKDVALLLSKGKVIARCAKRMEFGARALGNRSILADPIDIRIVERINRIIKNRDFWMPFAPVIIERYAEEYLINPKAILSPYMTVAFRTTSKGYDAMPAASHPADKTSRAQILRKDTNPQLYEILEEFEKITARGALLNTSFNLHGYPIVNTPQNAIDVFLKSGLDGVLLDNFLVLREKL